MADSRDTTNDLTGLDPSHRATAHLNALIEDTEVPEGMVILDEKIQEREAERVVEDIPVEALVTEPEIPESTEPVVSPFEARSEESVLQVVSERNSVRLLIFTKNIGLLQIESLSQKRLLELGGLFAEIHVVILSEKSESDAPTVRLADNVWVYTTQSRFWWKASYDAYTLVNEQLVFAGGFRADIILAEDPFESGHAAYLTSQKHERPFQVHVLEDITDPIFKEQDPHNALRLYLAHYILKRTHYVRTNSELLRAHIIATYPQLESGTETLPVYYNLEAWRDLAPTFDLKARYPQFKFIILHVSSMNTKSHTTEVVHGVAPLLRMYPTIGLVIVGSGPYRSAIEKLVLAFGVTNQIAFEPSPEELISHMKSAHVLIHLSEDPEDDATVLEAAAVKLPMIALSSGIAGTLFTQSESALLCERPDPVYVTEYLKMFLNDNPLRIHLASNAQETVFERIEQDYTSYLLAYRSSIERCV